MTDLWELQQEEYGWWSNEVGGCIYLILFLGRWESLSKLLFTGVTFDNVVTAVHHHQKLPMFARITACAVTGIIHKSVPSIATRVTARYLVNCRYT
jgi:hypothetical protein